MLFLCRCDLMKGRMHLMGEMAWAAVLEGAAGADATSQRTLGRR